MAGERCPKGRKGLRKTPGCECESGAERSLTLCFSDGQLAEFVDYENDVFVQFPSERRYFPVGEAGRGGNLKPKLLCGLKLWACCRHLLEKQVRSGAKTRE